MKLRLPGVGVDPDGDAVTLLGLGSAPRLGRIVTYGANSLEYQAYPGSGGTDEFQYRVVDAYGEPAVGTARVAVVPAGLPQPPLAVADTVTVAPGRRTTRGRDGQRPDRGRGPGDDRAPRPAARGAPAVRDRPGGHRRARPAPTVATWTWSTD